MFNDKLKNDLQVLAAAQAVFESNNWENAGSIQREDKSNSHAWGTIYQKDGRQFYLNINSAPKALQFIQNIA
jgi:hypothetical protein